MLTRAREIEGQKLQNTDNAERPTRTRTRKGPKQAIWRYFPVEAINLPFDDRTREFGLFPTRTGATVPQTLWRFRRTFVERVTRVIRVIFVNFTIFYYICCRFNKIIRTFVAANYYEHGNNDNHNDTTGDYHGGRIAARR